MNQSLRERAYRYLKGRPRTWVNGGDMERLAMDAGYKASTVSRRLRELAEESALGTGDLPGSIEREERPGTHSRSVWYRWVPEDRAQKQRIRDAEAVRFFDEYPDARAQN